LIWSGLSGFSGCTDSFTPRYKQTAQSGFFIVESEAAADAWVKRISEALQQQQQQQQQQQHHHHLSPNLNGGSGYVEKRGRGSPH